MKNMKKWLALFLAGTLAAGLPVAADRIIPVPHLHREVPRRHLRLPPKIQVMVRWIPCRN